MARKAAPKNPPAQARVKAAKTANRPEAFNVVLVGQAGRLQFEAALFCASFRAANPGFKGKLIVAEPQPGGAYNGDPRMNDKAVLELLTSEFNADIVPFEARHFGSSYQFGNKIELLSALPKGEPFIFFDSDTLILDDLRLVPFDFDLPSASKRVEGTWPKLELYGPGYTAIWKSLYDKFDLDFESSLDLTQPEEYWRRYLYFNAGFFYHRCPHEFGRVFLDYALAIRDDPPEELVCQEMHPWLDQVALPLVIHALGGGRDALEEGWLDGRTSCHYRVIPMLYAREDQRVVDVLEEITAPNRVKKVLKSYEPLKRMVFQGKGHKARALFDRAHLPRREQVIRNTLKRENLWMR